MQENRNKRSRRYHHYINKKQPQFEVTTYVGNPHKKQKLEIELAEATSKAEILDSEKKEARAEVKSMIDQLAEANAANHEMLLQNTAFEFRINDARSKLEMQDSQMENTLTRYHDLEERKENLQSANHQMELENLRLRIELNIANQRLDEVAGKWRTFPQYVVTIVATAILSFGTSMIASSPSSIPGWGMVIAVGRLEIVAFVITLTSRPKRIANPERTVDLERIAEPERVTEPERTAENG